MTILSLLWTLAGGLRGLVTAAVAGAATLALAGLYDRLVDDPAVAAAARRYMVAKAELDAERARGTELERQLTAGAQALEEYRRRLAAEQRAQDETDARHEQEIADYEKRLADAGRGCALDRDDIEFLRRP